MDNPLRSDALVKRVVNRLHLDAIIGSFHRWMLICSGVYGVLLLASRLLGLIPDIFDLQSLIGIPVSALVLCLLFHRRPTTRDAARRIDGHRGTKDLFLTLTLMESSQADFRPLVERDAESTAPSVKPGEVVPFRYANRLMKAGMTLLILWGCLHLKQFDPFGRVEAADQITKRKQELVQSKKATKIRSAQLKENLGDDRQSEDVKKALNALKTSFRKMKPREKKGNFRVLAERQKTLGEKWRKLSEKKLNQLLKQSTARQRFGSAHNDKLQQWTRELQEGSTDSLQKAMNEIREELQRLKKSTDPAEKAARAQKLKKKLRDLEKFASDRVNSKQLAAALNRAIKQLESSQIEGLSSESLEAMLESLDLANLELEEIAQSVKDLKALEEALKALQLAKRLNDREMLDGEACKNCVSMSDYEQLYAKMCAGMGINGAAGAGNGPGLGGKGIGRGGKAPEDDSVLTDFKAERSKSAVTAGKVLLSLKTKGLSNRGTAVKNYRNLIRNVKQGISEAIEQEQIPPGYHEGIKSYFDNIKPIASESDAGRK